jgi:hypothetical protein
LDPAKPQVGKCLPPGRLRNRPAFCFPLWLNARADGSSGLSGRYESFPLRIVSFMQLMGGVYIIITVH